MQKSIVITGAASGIGSAVCQRLNKKGFFVFAGVRDLIKGEALKESMSKPDNFQAIYLDVTKPDSIIDSQQKITEILKKKEIILHGIINNAADESLGPVEVLPIDVFRREIEVGYLGTVAICKAFISLLRENKGRIINISSMNGRFSFKNHSTSCATKYAVEAFSDSLRMELKKWGMHVVIVEPGLVDTDLMKDKTIEEFAVKIPGYKDQKAFALYFPNQEQTLESVKQYVESIKIRPKNSWQKFLLLIRGQWWLLAPDDIAQSIEHALCCSKPKTRYLVGLQANWWYFLRRILSDRWFDYFVAEKEFDF